jgi:hypothetical protein
MSASDAMTGDGQQLRRALRRLIPALAALVVLLAIVLVPPMIGLGRYKGRIAQLLSASLGRPVRLSSVELRLLPSPGFVLTDLTVEEDPAYGAEPLLHANTVTASIRLLSLWRGLEISRISVDEASLNLVRTPAGRWNVESLFRSAAQPGMAGQGRRPTRRVPLPYLEATDSRINVKNGAEKLPFSLIDADLSFWQESPGEWRIRMRGQPARTDLSLDLADTGVVRLEADVHRASALRQLPIRLDLEWREAQLGQLTRLLVGSDPGWRGNLTGELHVEGTPDAAKVNARLSAANVHRAEFAPASPMDFDANCSFVYRYSKLSVQGLECDSPLGDGRVHFTGDLPADTGKPRFSVELDRFPVALALDALRTVRNDLGTGIEAQGTASGKVSYDANVAPAPAAFTRSRGRRGARIHAVSPGPVTGSFTVQGLELTSPTLKQPIRFNRVTVEPVAAGPGPQQGEFEGFSATALIPAGAASPLTASSRLTLSGYQIAVHGEAPIARLAEMAQMAGLNAQSFMGTLTGDAAAVDLNAEGPWLRPEVIPVETAPAVAVLSPVLPADRLSGTLTLHNATWKADFLANPVAVSQATLHMDNGEVRWDPVAFSYGPVKGTASLDLFAHCDAPQGCPPAFQVQFGVLNAGELEAAVLGAHEPGTLLSELIARINPSRAPAWPQLQGTVKADALILGPVTLLEPSAALHILPEGAEITGLDAGLLGGTLYGTGKLQAAGTNGGGANAPRYSLETQFHRLNPAAVGQLLGLRWSGGVLEASGKIDLSGYTDTDLASSAKGELHFEWDHGSVAPGSGNADPSADPAAAPVPPALSRFDRWSADAEIGNGSITLKENQIQRGSRRSSIAAAVVLGAPLKVDFAPPKEPQSARKQEPPLQ